MHQICTVDPVSGLCIGCGRSLAEIACWLGFANEERSTHHGRPAATTASAAAAQLVRHDLRNHVRRLGFVTAVIALLLLLLLLAQRNGAFEGLGDEDFWLLVCRIIMLVFVGAFVLMTFRERFRARRPPRWRCGC